MRKPALFTELYKLFKTKYFVAITDSEQILGGKITSIINEKKLLFTFTPYNNLILPFTITQDKLFTNRKSANSALRRDLQNKGEINESISH